MSKLSQMISHANRKLKERYGLIASQALKEQLKKCIASQNYKLIERQSNRTSIYDIEYQITKKDTEYCSMYSVGQILMIRCVWDKQRHEFVTFLPRQS